MASDCPICGKAANDPFKPFCSKRCADIDLGRWFKGSYAVAAVETDDDPDEMEQGSGEEDGTTH